MSSTAQRRLLKDLKKMQTQDEEEGIFAAPVNENLFRWDATI